MLMDLNLTWFTVLSVNYGQDELKNNLGARTLPLFGWWEDFLPNFEVEKIASIHPRRKFTSIFGE
jgi:hypothetical protein